MSKQTSSENEQTKGEAAVGEQKVLHNKCSEYEKSRIKCRFPIQWHETRSFEIHYEIVANAEGKQLSLLIFLFCSQIVQPEIILMPFGSRPKVMKTFGQAERSVFKEVTLLPEDFKYLMKLSGSSRRRSPGL
jgi:hypothetical protein